MNFWHAHEVVQFCMADMTRGRNDEDVICVLRHFAKIDFLQAISIFETFPEFIKYHTHYDLNREEFTYVYDQLVVRSVCIAKWLKYWTLRVNEPTDKVAKFYKKSAWVTFKFSELIMHYQDATISDSSCNSFLEGIYPSAIWLLAEAGMIRNDFEKASLTPLSKRKLYSNHSNYIKSLNKKPEDFSTEDFKDIMTDVSQNKILHNLTGYIEQATQHYAEDNNLVLEDKYRFKSVFREYIKALKAENNLVLNNKNTIPIGFGNTIAIKNNIKKS